MSISPLSPRPMIAQLLSLRRQMDAIQQQFGTGRRAETFAGLGADRTLAVSFRQQLAAIASFRQTTETTGLRLSVLDAGLKRLGEIPIDAKAGFDPNALEVTADGRTTAQKTAMIALEEVLQLLNAEIDGRYLFAGNATHTKPVESLAAILDGAGGKAGLRAVLAERRLADLGVNLGTPSEPRHTGRTVVDHVPGGAGVTFAEEAAGSPFGLRVGPATGQLAGASVVHDPGSPGVPASLSVAFTGQPQPGETIRIQVGLPDGTEATIALAAGTETGRSTFAIGETPEATAASFAEALQLAVDFTARTELAAASAVAASRDFFDTAGGAAPRRVDGPPFETATALRDGAADTVAWYAGQNDGAAARSSVTARIDGSVTAAYGVHANEEGLARLVATLATMAVETFSAPGSAESRERHAALSIRARSALSYEAGRQSPRDIHGDIAATAMAVEQATQRHKVKEGTLKQFSEKVEGVDGEALAAELLTLQTRLAASYEATTILYRMSLVNYL